MATRLVHRPARLVADPLPIDPLVLPNAPTVDGAAGAGGPMAMRAILPLFAGLGMMAMMMSSGNPIRMIAGGVIVVGAVTGGILMFVYAKTGGRRKAEQQRGVFVEFVDSTRRDLEGEIADQRRVALRRHPEPVNLLNAVRDASRLWERRPGDADFLTVRLGTGAGPLARGVEMRGETDPLKRPEPIAQAHLERLVRAAERIDGLPVAVPLRGVVSVVGPRRRTEEALRALLTQVAVFHSPDDVGVHLALASAGSEADHRWALWLPHLLDPTGFDGPLGRRQVSTGHEDAVPLLEELARRVAELQEMSGRAADRKLEARTLIVCVDADDEHGRALLGELSAYEDLQALKVVVAARATHRHLEPGRVDTRVTVTEDRAVEVDIVNEGDEKKAGSRAPNAADRRNRRLVRGASTGSCDDVSHALAATIARRLAPVRLVEDATPEAPLETTVTLDRLLGLRDFGAFDVDGLWKKRSLEDFLNVPFGVTGDGRPVRLNLKEAAQNGMGPHGLCVGATGSGKSEVLRTIVLGQAVCHPPERLALVLVDYKGGAAFAGLERLPHTAAMVDNLSDDEGLVDRLHDALLGEMQRRQHVLQAAGSLPNTTEYNLRRDAGEDLEPLPDLLVVIDEFGEILTAKPEFIDLFVQMGRIGRSIGVHLLLATQRLEEGRLRGLESHLSYRIGLRTFSSQESRAAIGVPDAHELPPIPGSGLLRVDPDIFERFKGAYVSAPYVPRTDADDYELPPEPIPLDLRNTAADWLSRRDPRPSPHETATPPAGSSTTGGPRFGRTTLEVAAQRLGEHADPVRQIWLPPLPDALGLDAVVGPLTETRERGLAAAGGAHRGHLAFPLGLKDDPLRQWQGTLDIDFAGAGGNAVIMGSPQSGKTTALRSLVVGAAVTHTPLEAGFYVIDMGGSALAGLKRLPHTGDVATRFDADKIRRTVAEMATEMAKREQVFADHRIESVDLMRRMHREGRLPELFSADVFLVIDGWWTFRQEYEDLARQVQELAARGLGYGIHLVVTAGRWSDFRVQMQGLMGTRIELRLNDPLDSVVGRRVAEKIRPGLPGRCVGQDRLFAQICQPRHAGAGSGGEDALLQSITATWRGKRVPPVRMLPDIVTLPELRAEHPAATPVAIGVSETDLMPVHLDLFGSDQHVVAIGDPGSGRTNIARTVIEDLCPRYAEGQLVFAVLDLKRQLMEAVPEEFLGGYAGTVDVASALVESMVKEFVRRRPPHDVTPRQLRERSWWSGPEVVVIADDYDLMEGPKSPLRPLIPFLPQARDLGLHVMILRRGGGAGRAMYEPVIQAMKESGATGILLSGDRQEGQLWPDARMSTLPPGRADIIRRGGRPQRAQLALAAGRRGDDGDGRELWTEAAGGAARKGIAHDG